APVISPIIFSDNFEEFQRGSAVCTVTSGDPPIKISWFKDGHPLLSSSEKSSSRAKQSNSVLSNHYYRSSMFKSPGNQNHQHYYDYLNQIQIVSINDFMSSLIINNISRHHQGTYVCMASSPIATTNISAYLTVKASPMWLLKPVDRVAIAGESLTLDCQTSGQPQPVIRWKFLKNEPYQNEAVPILSSQQIHVLENGSLYLRALESKQSGFYICDASNEINKNSIDSRALIVVTNLPKVTIQNTLGGSSLVGNGPGTLLLKNNIPLFRGYNLDRLVLRKGAQTQLMCSVVSLNHPMNIEWLRPNGETSDEILEKFTHPSLKTSSTSSSAFTSNVYHHDSSRIVLREEIKLNEKRAYLFISHLVREDSGIYSCLGSNINGYSISFIELIVQETPDKPIRLRAKEISSRSVSLHWIVEFHGNSPITSYVVEYRIARKDSKIPSASISSSLSSGLGSNEIDSKRSIQSSNSTTTTTTANQDLIGLEKRFNSFECSEGKSRKDLID
ncbi:cell adhesion molecule-like protein 11, partial [Sarcoptes scabiei]